MIDSINSIPKLMKRLAIVLFVLLVCPLSPLKAEQRADPQVISLFPLGGRVGAGFEIQIRGENLEGTYGVWFDCKSLQGEVKGVETIEVPGKVDPITKEQKPKKGQQVLVEVKVGPEAQIGAHVLRLVTPAGVSGPLVLVVNAEAVMAESEKPHHTPDEAEGVNFLGVINGRIGKPGEVDYYAFDVSQGQELRFEVLTGSGLLAAAPGIFHDPELILYQASGSWFDPRRCTRLEAKDESIFVYFNGQHRLSRMRYRFEEAGRYLARVGSLEGVGGPEYSYQLRFVPAQRSRASEPEKWFPHALAHSDPLAWQEREFARKIEPNRLERLWGRTVQVPPEDDSEVIRGQGSAVTEGQAAAGVGDSRTETREVHVPTLLTPVLEEEPNETPGQAREIVVPSILEGKIKQPGDVDTFKFRVNAKDKLAFEIETPEASHPYFSPWLEVVQAGEQEVATNLFREVEGNSLTWKKTLQPKTIVTFEKAGQYYLRIRDLTSQRGNSRFSYRVLIRSQVPHVGAIGARTRDGVVDHLNLIAGETRKLSVVSEQEEGFSGDVALSMENLPPGVQALPAVAVEDKRLSQTVGMFGAINEQSYLPQRWVTTVVLLAGSETPATQMPHFIRLTARPIVGGKPGKVLVVQEIPLMVVKREAERVGSQKKLKGAKEKP